MPLELAADQGQSVPDSGTHGPEKGTGAPAVSVTPAELTDDTLVRIPGQDQPVKYGELYKRLQADHTRKTTEAAKLRAALDKERADWGTQRQSEESNLKQLAAQLLQRQSRSTEPNPLDSIRELPYVDGKTAAGIVQLFQEQGIAPIVGAIQERDKVIQYLHQQVLSLAQAVNAIRGQGAEQAFDVKINGWLKDLDLPAEAADLAKEIYVAYEGDDLDQEFPDILKKRWESVVNAIRKLDKTRVDMAKKARFEVPGKGGAGVAGKLKGLRGDESAKETSDYLWEMMQGGEEAAT